MEHQLLLLPPAPQGEANVTYPVHQAIRKGKIELAKDLILNNPQLLNAGDDMASTPLLVAARWGQIELCQWLLSCGANVHQTDSHQYNVIHWACDRGRLGLLALFLHQHQSPQTISSLLNARDILDYTPMMMAAYYGWNEVITYLLDQYHYTLPSSTPTIIKIDIDATTSEGQYSALYIASKNGHVEIVQQLLKAGADPTIHDDLGRDALDRARTCGHQRVIDVLEEALKETQRSYVLFKARLLHDVLHAIAKATTAAAAASTTSPSTDSTSTGTSSVTTARSSAATTSCAIRTATTVGRLKEVIADDEKEEGNGSDAVRAEKEEEANKEDASSGHRGSSRQENAPVVQVIPSYLRDRVWRGKNLPQVEISRCSLERDVGFGSGSDEQEAEEDKGRPSNSEGRGSTREEEEGEEVAIEGVEKKEKTGAVVLSEVVECVIKGELVDELFVELMEYAACPWHRHEM